MEQRIRGTECRGYRTILTALKSNVTTLTRGDEAAHFVRIFAARGGFDAAGGVDGGGVDLFDRGGDVGGIQAAAEDDGAGGLGDNFRGKGPVDGLSGSAVNAGGVRVEQEAGCRVGEGGLDRGLVGEWTGFDIKIPSPTRATPR